MLGGAILTLGILGCSSTPEPPASTEPVNLGWISTIVEEPSAFSALMEQTGREGWVQLHAHDDSRSTATFGKDPGLRSRPAWKVAMLEQDLADLSATAHDRLFRGWSTRGDLPPGGAAIAAWSAHCSDGDPEAWLGRVDPEDPGAPAVALIRTPPEDWPAPKGSIAERMAAHHAALTGDLRADWDRPTEPVLTVAGEVPRTWYDPCFHQVAAGHARRIAAPDGWPAAAEVWLDRGLAGTLFAPWLSLEGLKGEIDADARPGTWGSSSAARYELSDSPGLPGDSDVAQLAREQSRLVADRLQAHVRRLEAEAEANGQALLIDLDLAEHWSQQWHLSMARAALDADRPQQALAYAELGTDFSNEAGPQNPDGLYAVRAHALIRLGRTREALDALHGIEAVRGVRQLSEVVGDLAVLEGLDRAGDSKEN